MQQVGGIYTTDLLLLEAQAQQQQPEAQAPLQPEVRGLGAPNISVSLEPVAAVQAHQQQRRLVLRLWAEREGPLAEEFTLVLAPGQEVRRGVLGAGHAAAPCCPPL